MTAITTREVAASGATVKGSPLSNAEVDNNFIALNAGKVEKDNAQYLDFDTAASNTTGVAKLIWNDGEGTLEFGLKGGNVNLQIGQEQVLLITNTTGATLTDGQVVYITGAQGNRPTVALADADTEATSSKTFGVVTESIANGAEGFITTAGLVRGLNTSAFSEGVAIWLSGTAGAFTATKPAAPQHGVMVGWVVRSHATAGAILVHVQNGYELDELHDMLISAKANNDSIMYDAASGVWKNVPPSTARTNLDVYSKSEAQTVAVNNAIAMAIALG